MLIQIQDLAGERLVLRVPLRQRLDGLGVVENAFQEGDVTFKQGLTAIDPYPQGQRSLKPNRQAFQ